MDHNAQTTCRQIAEEQPSLWEREMDGKKLNIQAIDRVAIPPVKRR